jgi:carboxylesterase
MELIQNPQLNGDPFFWEAGPTGVLLMHGFTATTAEVRPLAEKLLAAGYTVAGPVLPGHNTDDPANINRYTWRDWVAEAEKAYRELATRCERVFVGGESTGGVLALWLAAHHPQISGSLLYAPAIKLRIRPVDQVKLHLIAPFVPYLPKQNKDESLPWKGYTVNPIKGVQQLLKLQKQVWPLLPQIRRPVLIIQGREDATVDPAVPDEIYRRVRATLKEIHWMENSGHCVTIDRDAGRVAEITLAFIAKVLT